jgi:hypothetical protein
MPTFGFESEVYKSAAIGLFEFYLLLKYCRVKRSAVFFIYFI